MGGTGIDKEDKTKKGLRSLTAAVLGVVALPVSVIIQLLGSPARDVIDATSVSRVVGEFGIQGYSLGVSGPEVVCIPCVVVEGAWVGSGAGLDEPTSGPEPGVPLGLTFPPLDSIDCQVPVLSL